MFRKKKDQKKVIWWESDPVVSGSEDARTRGDHEGTPGRNGAASPYYGPVTIAGASELGPTDPLGLITR